MQPRARPAGLSSHSARTSGEAARARVGRAHPDTAPRKVCPRGARQSSAPTGQHIPAAGKARRLVPPQCNDGGSRRQVSRGILTLPPNASLPARSAAIFCPNGAAYTSPGQGPPACPATVQRRRDKPAGPPPWDTGSLKSPPSHALQPHGRGEGGWASEQFGPRIPWGMPGRRRGKGNARALGPPRGRRVRRVALLKRASRPGCVAPRGSRRQVSRVPFFLFYESLKNCGIGSCR